MQKQIDRILSTFKIAFILLVIIVASGCGGGTEVGNPGPSVPVPPSAAADIVASQEVVLIEDAITHETAIEIILDIHADVDRITDPQIDPADLTDQVYGNQDFAFVIYQAIRSQEENLFYSPHSISLAMAMIYAGARGNTEAQIADALRFVLVPDRLHPIFNELDLELSDLNLTDDGFQLSIANSIWGQDGYAMEIEFLEILATQYGAGIKTIDFENNPEGSRLVINAWIDNQTDSRILDLMPELSIDANTNLILADAVYFKASWFQAFNPVLTEEAFFHLADGTAISVQMMSTVLSSTGHADEDDYQALEIPYGKDGSYGSLSMVVVVPDQGALDTVEQKLDGDMVRAIIDSLGSKEVTLTMPTFEFDSELSLKHVFRKLGMTDAFDVSLADFSGISKTAPPLFIGNIFHKTFIKVDEAGTEAAASTGVIMRPPSDSVPTPVVLTLNRPFVFLIYDRSMETILFIGRVLDPRK